jgi:hypothetical protein
MGGGTVVDMKRDPLELMERCTRFSGDGEEFPPDEEHRRAVEGQNARAADRGLRVLGVARTTTDGPAAIDDAEAVDLLLDENDLGDILVAFRDGRPVQASMWASLGYLLVADRSEIILLMAGAVAGTGFPTSALNPGFSNLACLALVLASPKKRENPVIRSNRFIWEVRTTFGPSPERRGQSLQALWLPGLAACPGTNWALARAHLRRTPRASIRSCTPHDAGAKTAADLSRARDLSIPF